MITIVHSASHISKLWVQFTGVAIIKECDEGSLTTEKKKKEEKATWNNTTKKWDHNIIYIIRTWKHPLVPQRIIHWHHGPV